MLFAKNIGTNATKVPKNISNEYSQKFIDSAKKSTSDAIKTALSRTIQKTEEETGDSTGLKIADKIKSISKSPQNFSKELHSKIDENEIEILKKRQKFIDELRLV